MERDLAKVEAAGSSPVSRSFNEVEVLINTALPLFLCFHNSVDSVYNALFNTYRDTKDRLMNRIPTELTTTRQKKKGRDISLLPEEYHPMQKPDRVIQK